MRNFKLIGMALLAIMLCMNFVSCSDDDKDIDVISLEGTWGMTYCKYFDYRDNSLSEEEYNPYAPSENNEKWVIKKLGDNKYSCVVYVSDDKGNWEIDGDWTGILNDNKIILSIDDDNDDEEDVVLNKSIPSISRNSGYNAYIIIKELTSDNLKLYLRYIEEGGEDYEETITFVRMQ